MQICCSCYSIAYRYPAVQEIVHLPLLLPWQLEGKSISSAVFVILPSSCFSPSSSLPHIILSFFYPNFFALCLVYLCFMQDCDSGHVNSYPQHNPYMTYWHTNFFIMEIFFAYWLLFEVCFKFVSDLTMKEKRI